MQAVHIEPYGDPDNMKGGFYDDTKREMLPLVVESGDLAVAFLSACERIGVDIGELSQQHLYYMYYVWHDAFKRPA
jgi:hypothetical protein